MGNKEIEERVGKLRGSNTGRWEGLGVPVSFSLPPPPPHLRTVCAWAWDKGALAAAWLPASLCLAAVAWGSECQTGPFSLI